MRLKDKGVVITGGSKGLGKALAEVLMWEGCKVIISSRNEADLKSTAEKLGCLWKVADVTTEANIRELAEYAVNKFGRIDLWINNAGVRIPHAPIEETDWKRAHEVIEVNLFGLAYGSKYALLHLKKNKSGMIVNILSTAALQGRANSSAYVASKYAATGFTHCLRLEAKPFNIEVIAVYPGGMKTEFFRELVPVDYDKYMEPLIVAGKIVDNLKKEIPEEELIIRREM